MKLKLIFLMGAFVNLTVHASDIPMGNSGDQAEVPLLVFEDMPDDTFEGRVQRAIDLSLETTQAAEAFRAKQAAMAATPQSSIGKVAFETLMANAGDIAGNSRNQDEIQSMINQVRQIQGEKSLTETQANDLDDMLVSLVTQMSTITNAQKLGAPNM